MKALFIASLMVASCTLGATAYAQPADGGVVDPNAEAEVFIREGHRLYNELDFVGAVDALLRALAIEGTSDAVRVNALELLGAAYVVLEQPEDARAAFRSMLQIDPTHQVHEPSGSPKITDFVSQVRAEMSLDSGPEQRERLTIELPRVAREDRPIRVRILAMGQGEIAFVRLMVRNKGESFWRAYRPTRTVNAFIVILAPRSAGTELELYAEGYDADSRLIAHAGSSTSPMSLYVRAKDGGSFTSKWWFWSGIGVLVAGAVVTSVILLSGDDEAPAGSLSPGRVQLP